MEATAAVPPRLKERYEKEIRPALKEQFGFSSIDADAPDREDHAEHGRGRREAGLERPRRRAWSSSPRSPARSRACAARASRSPKFKLRDGMPVGVSVTLRRARMWEFLDRLTSVAIPRIRDFRGLNPRSFDGRGNYSMGIREQIIFPEIDYDSIDQVRGLDVTITTSAATDEQAYYLLRDLGMPFAREGAPGQAPADGRGGGRGAAQGGGAPAGRGRAGGAGAAQGREPGGLREAGRGG